MGYKLIFISQCHIFIILIIIYTTTTILSSSTPILQPLPPPPRPPPPLPHNYALKPSMTIIIGVLTTIFSITFLFLLYAKHCRRSNNRYPPTELTAGTGWFTDRDNSGIDRTIIESLPVFRFGSLTGQKDGLECAVCLSAFDPSEVLRLLPKCKHAFHVECVDTWLDAHSTCPLCRYRVDPEDIFLILNENEASNNIYIQEEQEKEDKEEKEERELPLRRVSGRHSSAGELYIQMPAVTPPTLLTTSVAGSRRSLDSWNCSNSSNRKKKSRKTKKKDATTMPVKSVPAVTSVGTETSRHRKDGLLLLAETEEDKRKSEKQRFEHRIVVGTSGAERWSDVQPSDLLYLRSEMIISDVRRLKRSRPSVLHEGNNGLWKSGRNVINSRSVSEMTGLSRFGSNGEAGVVSRLLARLSEPRSGRNSSSSDV